MVANHADYDFSIILSLTCFLQKFIFRSRIKVIHAPLAQLDRATAFEAVGQTFESSRARHKKTPRWGVFLWRGAELSTKRRNDNEPLSVTIQTTDAKLGCVTAFTKRHAPGGEFFYA